MKDFIVWDKVLKCFHLDGRVKLENGILKPIGKDYTIHKGIGLKDINGKSIYADCSIVEWLHQNVTYQGYFKFNVEKLYYEVIIIGSDMDNIYESVTVAYHYLNMNCLKIIDTIQENKLGLIK